MVTLTMDGERAALEGGPETLGDLLAAADARCAGHGRIVTALRLDGAEEPAFREPQVIARKLSTLRTVDIESGTPAELAASCLSEVGLALHALADAAAAAAAHLRAGNITLGNQQLGAITQGMATVLTISSAASLGLGFDLGACETAHGTLSSIAQRASRDLESLIAAQVNADRNAVATILEHDLQHSLRLWGEICGAIDISAAR
jgi:hypothetical protein